MSRDLLLSGVTAFGSLALSKVVISVCMYYDVVLGPGFKQEYCDVIMSFLALGTSLLAAFKTSTTTEKWVLSIGGIAQGLVAIYVTWIFIRVVRAVNSAGEHSDINFEFNLKFSDDNQRHKAEVSTLCNVFFYLPVACLHSAAAQGLFAKLPSGDNSTEGDHPTGVKDLSNSVSDSA